MLEAIYNLLCTAMGKELVKQVFTQLNNFITPEMTKFEMDSTWNSLSKLTYSNNITDLVL